MLDVAGLEGLAEQNMFYHNVLKTWNEKIRNASYSQLSDWIDELTPPKVKMEVGKFDFQKFKLVLTRFLSEQSSNTVEAARLMVLLAIVEKLARELEGRIT